MTKVGAAHWFGDSMNNGGISLVDLRAQIADLEKRLQGLPPRSLIAAEQHLRELRQEMARVSDEHTAVIREASEDPSRAGILKARIAALSQELAERDAAVRAARQVVANERTKFEPAFRASVEGDLRSLALLAGEAAERLESIDAVLNGVESAARIHGFAPPSPVPSLTPHVERRRTVQFVRRLRDWLVSML